MVIISPILERDSAHGDILANTAGAYVMMDKSYMSIIPMQLL